MTDQSYSDDFIGETDKRPKEEPERRPGKILGEPPVVMSDAVRDAFFQPIEPDEGLIDGSDREVERIMDTQPTGRTSQPRNTTQRGSVVSNKSLDMRRESTFRLVTKEIAF